MQLPLPDKHLHIVCLDVPYPVDYGGVFDLFYKIKTLSEAGIKIHLHCFEYGRGRQPVLDEYCVEVNYYERHQGISGLSKGLPYIVSSRANDQLIVNLQKDQYPVLMEGIHCTYFVHTGQLPPERCFVRLHNVEYQYYHQLWETSTSFFKKIYYKRESKLLKAYEAGLASKATFWTVTEKDMKVFNKELGYNSVDYLPLYLPEFSGDYTDQRGHYCLYHGNLGVAENEFAATWLLENIFNEVEIPFVIAGKNPGKDLETLAHKYPHTCIVSNPDDREMNELIKKAQVNILPSFNSTGIKLKLINALYKGKHCLVNLAGVEGSGLDACCTIANSKADMQHVLVQLFEQPFQYYAFEDRMKLLDSLFNNKRNAAQMIDWIFNHEPTIPGAHVLKQAAA